jgi:hypothetical protein
MAIVTAAAAASIAPCAAVAAADESSLVECTFPCLQLVPSMFLLDFVLFLS